jgi:hypothetical protein
MARERWRKVRRAPGYQVSDRGRVRSVPRVLSDGRRHGGGLLAQYQDADGYQRVSIAGRSELVHVLVLEAFHGPRPAGMEGCHGPKGQQVNTAAELRWDSKAENERDKKRTGRLEMDSRSRPCLVGTSGTGDVPDE